MLCLVRSDSDILESSWLNRMAAAMARTEDQQKPFIHAELLFVPPHTSGETKESVKGTACSIVYSGRVHLEKKRFSRKEWFFRSMTCTKAQYDKMYAFAESHQGDKFNTLGYFLHWSPIRPSPTFYSYLGMRPRWYCSEIVIATLKEGGILDSNVATSMHPHDLYKLMKQSTMADCGRTLKEMKLSFV